MTSSRAREFAAVLLGCGTVLSGCIITRADLHDGVDAFTTEDAGRDARMRDDVRELDGGTDAGGDSGGDAGPSSVLVASWQFTTMATLFDDSEMNAHVLMDRGTRARSSSGRLKFNNTPGLMTPDAPDFDEVTAVSLWALPSPAPNIDESFPIVQSTGRLSITYVGVADGDWRYRCTDGVATAQAPSSTLANWAHLACVRRGASLELYVDGALVQTEATSPGADSNVGYFLGVFPDGSSSRFVSNGELDSVRLWRVAPTATEIMTDFVATSGDYR